MTTQWGSAEHVATVKFGARIENDGNPIDVRVVEDRPRYSRDTRYIGEKHAPVRLGHRTGIVLGLISLVMIVEPTRRRPQVRGDQR